MDSDDLLHKDTLSIMMDCYNKNRNSIIIAGYERFRNDNTDFLKSNINKDYTTIDLSYKHIRKKRGGYFVWGVLYDLTIINNNNIRFPNAYCIEDEFWNSVYFAYASDIKYINLPLYKYRINLNSITCNDTSFETAIKRFISSVLISEEVKNRNLLRFQKNKMLYASKRGKKYTYWELFTDKISLKKFICEIVKFKEINKRKIIEFVFYYYIYYCFLFIQYIQYDYWFQKIIEFNKTIF